MGRKINDHTPSLLCICLCTVYYYFLYHYLLLLCLLLMMNATDLNRHRAFSTFVLSDTQSVDMIVRSTVYFVVVNSMQTDTEQR